MSNVLVAPSGPALAAVRQVVDSFGATFGRPLGAVDREFNQLARSNGDSPLVSPAQLASRVRQSGGFVSLQPVWLPADPTLAAPATVWVPIRCDGRLLGFLWLAHPEVSLSREDAKLAGLAVRAIAEALRHSCTDRDLLVRELLGADVRARQRALRRVLKEQPHAANLGVIALVVAGVEDSGGLRSQRLGDAVRGYPFKLVAEDHTCLLIQGRPSVSAAVVDRLAVQMDGVVGVGQWYPNLRFAYESYLEARGAARAAARLADLGRVVHWTALGVYRTFVHLSEGALARCSIHPALERLFTEPAHQQLLATLETYLDLAGNVPLAAQQLHLHRASLYYRLRRIQELLQADLRDGHQRLCLHMAFKLGRFNRRFPLPHAPLPVANRWPMVQQALASPVII